MTPRPLKFLWLLLAAAALGQEPELLNTAGSQLDTPAKRAGFKEALGIDWEVDVRDFKTGTSGIPDDGLDDHAAIQAAVTYAEASLLTRTVRLVGGEWHSAGPIEIRRDNLTLVGAGHTTRLNFTDSSAHGIVGVYAGLFPPDLESGPHRWTVKNLVIQGVGSATATGYGVYFANGGLVSANRVQIEDCVIRGWAQGFHSSYTVNTELRRIRFEDNPISIRSIQSDTLRIVNCWTGYLAGSTCLLSTAGGTGVIEIVGGEHGNCATLFDVTGGTLVVNGANFETVTGTHAIRTHQCELSMRDCNYATISGPLVRNSGNANVAVLENVYPRSGVSTGFDTAFFGYQTNVAGDTPIIRNSPLYWTRTTADFSAVLETHSHRDPLPFGGPVYVQKVNLAAAPTSGSGYAVANNGFVSISAAGLDVGSWTTASSSAVCNLSKGNVYNPVMCRAGDGQVSALEWDRRMMIRFTLSFMDQGSGASSNDKYVVRFGDPYNSTATGNLTGKGIGILVEGTAVKAIVHNGSTQSEVALGTLSQPEAVEIVLDHDGAGTLKASMTGEAEVTRTGGPTGTSAFHANSITIAAWNSGASTAIPHRRINDLEIAYY